MIDSRWDDLSESDWNAFAIAWNSELCGDDASSSIPKLPWLLDDAPSTASEYVVPMNFTASAASQWKFILVAYRTGTEDTHRHLAAGPVEHLLGEHGDEYISLFEQLADEDARFAKMLRNCLQNQMSGEVWRRLCLARSDGG
ncbi:DUF6869 domain-containing protein [Rhodopirellula baltica]|uniref:DUF6869 domain-containing protein n=1 Tax=Rhodopirellula baltica TaxID=265606 RepID=UPI0005630D3E|nr:hypothetical protein [Rhodopirellula baltica]